MAEPPDGSPVGCICASWGDTDARKQRTLLNICCQNNYLMAVIGIMTNAAPILMSGILRRIGHDML